MSSPTDRAPFRSQPCKKQESSSNSLSSHNQDQQAIKKHFETNNLSNKKDVMTYSLSNQNIHSMDFPMDQNPSTIIKATLQTKNKRIWTAKLPETSKSSTTQRKISAFFKAIAEPKANTDKPSLPTEYLPSQRLFKLASTIRQSAAVKPQTTPRPTAQQTSSSPSSPFMPSEPKSSSSSLSMQSSQPEFVEFSHTGSRDLELIFKQDEYQYSREESRSISESSDTSNNEGSIFLPSIPLPTQGQSNSPPRRLTRSRQKRPSIIPSQVNTSHDSAKSSVHPKQQSINSFTKQSLSRGILSSNDWLQRAPRIPPQIKIVLDKQPRSPCRSLSIMVDKLTSQCKEYQSLQQEILERQSFIDERIQSLSKPQNPSPVAHLSQSLPNETPLRNTHQQNKMRPSFKHLNYAGSKDDDTFRSSCTSSIEKSAMSTLNQSTSSSSSSSASSSSSFIKGSLPNDLKGSQICSKFRYLNYAGSVGDDTFNSSCTSSIQMSSSESSQTTPPAESSSFASSKLLKKFRDTFQHLYQQEPDSEATSNPPSNFAISDIPKSPTPPPEQPQPQQVIESSHDLAKTLLEASQDVRFEQADDHTSSSDSSYIPSDNSIEDEENQDNDSQGFRPSVVLTPPSLAPRPSHIVLPSSVRHENPEIKTKGSIRVISQNCRGVFHKGVNASDSYAPSMESFKMYSPDLLLLTETNTDWLINDNAYETKLINKAVWAPTPTSTYVSSCKWDNLRKTNYQPGGVMSVVLDNMTSRIKTNFRDPFVSK